MLLAEKPDFVLFMMIIFRLIIVIIKHKYERYNWWWAKYSTYIKVTTHQGIVKICWHVQRGALGAQTPGLFPKLTKSAPLLTIINNNSVVNNIKCFLIIIIIIIMVHNL